MSRTDITYYAQLQKEVTKLDEIAKNNTAMRRITKIYNRVTIVYAAIYLPYALICLIAGIMMPEINAAGVIFDTFILKSGIVVFGILSCYKHKNSYALYALIFQVISAIFNIVSVTFLDLILGMMTTDLSFNSLLTILSAVLCIITIFSNKQYAYLETQSGFPHFNERRINQEFDKKQREIKDEYQQNYERIIKTSSDTMSDVDLNSRDTFPVHKTTPEYDYEHAHDEPERMQGL